MKWEGCACDVCVVSVIFSEVRGVCGVRSECECEVWVCDVIVRCGEV